MQKMFLAMLAVVLLWSGAAKADETVEMDGHEYPNCVAAQPYAYGNDGKLKLAFVENCPENARQMSARPMPSASKRTNPDASAVYAQAQQQGNLSGSELTQLNSLQDRRAVELLGARTPNSLGYLGQKGGHMDLPPQDGCTEVKVPDQETHRVFVRVDCTTGRHRSQ